MTRTRNRFAALIAAALISTVAIPGTASALGPGGWDHVGQTSPTVGPITGGAGIVDALNTDMPGKLIAGGSFTGAGQPGGNTFYDDSVAIWDGTSWSPLRSGPGAATDVLPGSPALVRALEFDPTTGKIYAGGSFQDNPAGPEPDFLAVWDTNNTALGWQQVCNPNPGGGNVNALKLVGTDLYVGGNGQDWAVNDGADELFKCDLTVPGGAVLEITPTDTETGGINALATDSNGKLYAGGGFFDWDNTPTADHVVSYQPPSDVPQGTAGGIVAGPVRSLATIGTDLYVGTDEENIAGDPGSDNIAVWDGSVAEDLANWSNAGTDSAGTEGFFFAAQFGQPEVASLVPFGTGVFASGHWQNANGNPLADKPLRFESACVPQTPPGETCWDTLGSNGAGDGPFGTTGTGARGLAVFNGNLYVGGNFQNAGGDLLADSMACFSLGVTPCTPGPPVVNTPPPTTTPIATIPDPVPPVKCKKTQKLKNGKCVKKKKKGKKKPRRPPKCPTCDVLVSFRW